MNPEEFRRHGHAVVDWIAEYLAHPECYPVLPKVQPGDLIDALPASAPERGRADGGDPRRFPEADRARHHALEPSRLHGLLLQYSAPGPGILAESARRRAERQRHALEDLARRHRTGAGGARLAAPVDRACRPSSSASSTTRPPSAPCTPSPRRAKRPIPDARTRGAPPGLVALHLRAGAFVDREGRDRARHRPAVRPQDRRGRRIPHARRTCSRRPSSATSPRACARSASPPPSAPPPPPAWTRCRAIADIAERYNLWLHVDAAYAGVGGHPARVPAHSRRRRARRFARDEPAQVAVHAHGLQRLLHAPPGHPAPRLLAGPRIPAHGRAPARRQLHGLRRAARPPLPRAQAVVRDALLRPRGH